MTWEFQCPNGWKLIDRWGDGYCLREIGGGLRVIIDCSEKEDGNRWIHVSYSRKDWTPGHLDTVKVKAAFLGDRYAYVVYPPMERYVNIHEHCLHLWAREDGAAVLPEFSGQIAGVNSI